MLPAVVHRLSSQEKSIMRSRLKSVRLTTKEGIAYLICLDYFLRSISRAGEKAFNIG